MPALDRPVLPSLWLRGKGPKTKTADPRLSQQNLFETSHHGQNKRETDGLFTPSLAPTRIRSLCSADPVGKPVGQPVLSVKDTIGEANMNLT